MNYFIKFMTTDGTLYLSTLPTQMNCCNHSANSDCNSIGGPQFGCCLKSNSSVCRATDRFARHSCFADEVANCFKIGVNNSLPLLKMTDAGATLLSLAILAAGMGVLSIFLCAEVLKNWDFKDEIAVVPFTLPPEELVLPQNIGATVAIPDEVSAQEPPERRETQEESKVSYSPVPYRDVARLSTRSDLRDGRICTQDSIYQTNECSICCEPFEKSRRNISIPRCGHKFHTHCLVLWTKTTRDTPCPLCKQNILSVPDRLKGTHDEPFSEHE